MPSLCTGGVALHTGAVVVRGDGSNCSQGFVVFHGYDGTAALVIEDGGSASSAGGVWLGGWEDEGFGNATVTVTGPGSNWMIRDDLTVGISGSGALMIKSAAEVSNADGWIGLNPGAGASESVPAQESESLPQACALRPVTEGNCAAGRRGGEQPEVNRRSVG